MTDNPNIHAEATDLLDSTMSVLEGDISGMTPQTGKGIIDQWIEQLRHADNTAELADLLEQLKNQLEGGQPDPQELSNLLQTMSEQAREIGTMLGAEGDLATRIEGLSAALRTASGEFGKK